MSNYKTKQEYRSIQNSFTDKKPINKLFVLSFEKNNHLEKNKEWLTIKNSLKFI